MSAFVVIVVTTLLIVLSAFFVVIEFALLGARRPRLESDASWSRSARAALRGMNELTVMLALAQLGITACTFALGAVTKPAVDAALKPTLSGWGAPNWAADSAAFALALLFVTFLHLVVGEMAPKSWAIAHPERAGKLIGLPSRAFAWVFRPLLRWINSVANRLVAASGITPVDRAMVGGRDADAIRHLVEHSASVGALDAGFRTHISWVLDLDRLTLADLVPPGKTPTAVAADATADDVQAAAIRSGHMRILVDGDDTTRPGLVHVRDTLREPSDRAVAELARRPLELDAGIRVYEALTRMRTASEQLAIVTRDGRPIGIVTVTDILRRLLPREDAAAAGTSQAA